MINKILQSFEESEARYELDVKAHSQGKCSFSTLAQCAAVEQEVKAFLRSHTIKLLESVVDGMPGKKALPVNMNLSDEELGRYTRNANSYNQALTASRALIDEALEKLKQLT